MKHAKHAIFWNTPSMSFYEAYQVCHFVKHTKQTILKSRENMPFYESRQAHHFTNYGKHTIFEACHFIQHANLLSTSSS